MSIKENLFFLLFLQMVIILNILFLSLLFLLHNISQIFFTYIHKFFLFLKKNGAMVFHCVTVSYWCKLLLPHFFLWQTLSLEYFWRNIGIHLIYHYHYFYRYHYFLGIKKLKLITQFTYLSFGLLLSFTTAREVHNGEIKREDSGLIIA